MSLVTPATAQRLYLTRIQEEHGRIFQAICDADPAEARRAMRAHLTRSLSRYRRLAEHQPRTIGQRPAARRGKQRTGGPEAPGPRRRPTDTRGSAPNNTYDIQNIDSRRRKRT